MMKYMNSMLKMITRGDNNVSVIYLLVIISILVVRQSAVVCERNGEGSNSEFSVQI